MLELCRTVDHCSSTVSFDSFSVVDVVGRVYGPYPTSVMNLIHFKKSDDLSHTPLQKGIHEDNTRLT